MFRKFIHRLRNVDLAFLKYKQKLAFWINVYNACIMNVIPWIFNILHAYLMLMAVSVIPGVSSARSAIFFRKIAGITE